MYRQHTVWCQVCVCRKEAICASDSSWMISEFVLLHPNIGPSENTSVVSLTSCSFAASCLSLLSRSAMVFLIFSSICWYSDTWRKFYNVGTNRTKMLLANFREQENRFLNISLKSISYPFLHQYFSLLVAFLPLVRQSLHVLRFFFLQLQMETKERIKIVAADGNFLSYLLLGDFARHFKHCVFWLFTRNIFSSRQQPTTPLQSLFPSRSWTKWATGPGNHIHHKNYPQTWFSKSCSCCSFHISSSSAAWYSCVCLSAGGTPARAAGGAPGASDVLV